MELSGLALHFEMKTSPSAADLDEIQNYLYDRCFAREKAELENLKGLFNAFRKVSFLAGNLPPEESQEHWENKKVSYSYYNISELINKTLQIMVQYNLHIFIFVRIRWKITRFRIIMSLLLKVTN